VYAEIEFPAVQGQRSFHNLVPREAYVAIVRGYNNWLSEEFCSLDPERLLGCALLPATTVDDAIEELTRVSTMPGICTVILHHWPNGGPLPTEEDDRFWQVALGLDFPVSVHVGVGSSKTGQATKLPKGHFNNQTTFGTLGASSYSQLSMIQFILTGVLDRFPELRLVFAEVGVGWIPNWLERLDRSYLRHQDWTGFEFKRMPSEYIRRHFLFGFQDDFYGVEHRHEIGVDKMMWANDFPHSAGDWPDSIPLIEEMFEGVPEEEARLMLGGNCARFYKLGAAATEAA
jgi:predicted TIM-barrel fold metal-dependent hydrolase